MMKASSRSIKPEHLFAIYSVYKAVAIGLFAPSVLGWPYYATLPAGLVLSFIPLISEGALVYFAAADTGDYVRAAVWYVLLPFAALCIVPFLLSQLTVKPKRVADDL